MAKVSCRKAFSDTLLKIAKENKDIYTLATDSRGSVTTKFFNELPAQSVELGIAEQNAVAMGAGLALTGKNVFVTSPACFLAARAYEQVKVDVDGGPTASTYLMQFQSDMAQVNVQVPNLQELSGMGVAYATGIATGLYDKEKVFGYIQYKTFYPSMPEHERTVRYNGWINAIDQSLRHK